MFICSELIDDTEALEVGESDETESETDLEEHPAKITVSPASQLMVDVTVLAKRSLALGNVLALNRGVALGDVAQLLSL